MRPNTLSVNAGFGMPRNVGVLGGGGTDGVGGFVDLEFPINSICF